MSYVAIFDLDETIISCKSLFNAYQFFCFNHPDISFQERYASTIENIKKLQLAGVHRNEINRAFYSSFKGINKLEMEDLALDWFKQSLLNDKSFFNQAVLDELRAHQLREAIIIIVSGSFLECVKPVADYLGVSDLICIELECAKGCFTGNISGIQTIGEGKLLALNHFIKKSGLSLKGSYAYGDHPSDLPMLELADHRVIVGDNDIMLDKAFKASWDTLSV